MEDRARAVEQVEADDRAARRYAWRRYGGEYLLWFAIGILLMFWSFHTTDSRAELGLWSGILIGDAGMLSVLVRLQLHSEKHGLS